MAEIILCIVFIAGLFFLHAATEGMPTKIIVITTLAYIVIFPTVAGLLARL